MKRTFTRFAAVLLSAVLAFSLVSCEKEDNPSKDNNENKESTLDPSDFSQTSPWSVIGTIGGANWTRTSP